VEGVFGDGRAPAVSRGGRCATPISRRPRSKTRSSPSSRRGRTGTRARFASSWCAAYPVTCASPRRAPSTPCCIGTVWSKVLADLAIALRARRCRQASPPTICGAPTSRGEFKLGDSQYCYQLTVTDHASRYLLLCEALESVREDLAMGHPRTRRKTKSRRPNF
jgi:hypothetical protein